MRRCRAASNTAALSFSPRAPQQSADFVKPHRASRSAAESFSGLTASALARAECARFPFSVPRKVESEEDALNLIMDARQLAASASGKSSWTKYPRVRIAVKREQAGFRFRELATGSGRSRAALRVAAAARLMEAEPATGCEPSLFLVGRVRPLVLQQLIRKSPDCH